MAGIYLHIPYCRQACHYCDFHFSTNLSDRRDMVDALLTELDLQRDYLEGLPIESIYFGGGTPSLLGGSQFETLLRKIRSLHFVNANVEITLEANPDDLTEEKLSELSAAGINRLSIGIQSFNDDMLKFLNRAHDAKTARACLSAVRKSGFDNISLDLIYAIPGLDHPLWNETIREAVSYSPEHLSAYSLTIEDRTVFGHWMKQGKLAAADEETAAHQFEMLSEALDASGYEHYEISNYARPGFLSRHNNSYWKQIPYLGIGPGAHSYNRHTRQYNISNNALYVRALHDGKVPFEREMLSRENRINEYIMTTLRTSWGCDLQYLDKELQFDLLLRRKQLIDIYVEKGLVAVEQGALKLTRRGQLLADRIACDLMEPG